MPHRRHPPRIHRRTLLASRPMVSIVLIVISDMVLMLFNSNAIYENVYLLGTSLARPVIARAQMAIAEKENCFAVSHGCVSHSSIHYDNHIGPHANLSRRLERVMTRSALSWLSTLFLQRSRSLHHGACETSIKHLPKPQLTHHRPEFYERFPGREALLDYAASTGIPVSSTKSKPWSMDENLAHCSYEAGILEGE